MRVALLGNTCNNNFAFLRYLLDLGIETHLFLYSNEGKEDSNPIHSPLWDSYSFDHSKRHVSYLDIPNGLISVIGRPDKFILPLNLKSFSKVVSEYDICVGSGLTPAIFKRLKKRLDVFYPYSTGIEWVGDIGTKKKLSKLNLELPLRKILLRYQLGGLRDTRKIVNWMPGNSEDVLKRFYLSFNEMHVPVYYPEENVLSDEDALKKLNISLIKKIKDNNTFKIFSFMRHFWSFDSNNYDNQTWPTANKNNDMLIKGFKKFLDKFPDAKAILFLSEWGADLEKSRKLVSKLSIENRVEWLPLLPRSYISFILSKYAQLAVGEFIISPNETWGSTAWECIALGVPFMQSINFTDSYFEKKFGYPLPPKILDVKSSEDVAYHIERYCFNKNISGMKEKENIYWFNNYNSHALAKRWVNLFQEIIDNKSN